MVPGELGGAGRGGGGGQGWSPRELIATGPLGLITLFFQRLVFCR